MIVENDDGSTTVFRKGREPEVRPAGQFFYVDIPKPDPTVNGEWLNVGQFDTREECEAFLLETWGIQQEHAHLFITEGSHD